MRIFIVSLEEDLKKREDVMSRLAQLNMSAEWFPATYGKLLPYDEKRKLVSYFKWHCIVGQYPTDGEIGCALSHVYLYRKMCEEGVPIACVLEDDVILDDNFGKQLGRVENFCREEDDAVVLLTDKYGTGSQNWEINRIVQENGTYGYVVTQKAAATLAAANTPLIVPSDYWKWLCRKGRTKMFKASPAVCGYDPSCESKTGYGRIAVKDMNLARLARYKVLRTLGLLWARLAY